MRFQPIVAILYPAHRTVIVSFEEYDVLYSADEENAQDIVFPFFVKMPTLTDSWIPRVELFVDVVKVLLITKEKADARKAAATCIGVKPMKAFGRATVRESASSQGRYILKVLPPPSFPALIVTVADAPFIDCDSVTLFPPARMNCMAED